MNENDEKESFYRDTIEDTGAENYQLEDPMTFWNAEKKTFWKKMLGRTEMPFVLMGIGLVLVVIVFYALYPRGEDRVVYPDSDAISGRLQQIEEKIGAMEMTIEGLKGLQQDMEPVKNAILRLDSSDASTMARLDSMDERLAFIQKEVEEIKTKTSTGTKPPVTPTQTDTKNTASEALFYEVQQGDTLYSIGRRYGVGVDAIRKMNDLSEQDAIIPGQKLKVKEEE